MSAQASAKSIPLQGIYVPLKTNILTGMQMPTLCLKEQLFLPGKIVTFLFWTQYALS